LTALVGYTKIDELMKLKIIALDWYINPI